MAIELPHTFHDGPGNVASGVQVMENLNVLKEAIEALQSSSPGHYFVTTGGLEGAGVVKGSKQTVTNAANTKVSYEGMLTATWNSSTEGGYTIKLLRDGVTVREETLSVSANKAGVGYWVGKIEIDYEQEAAGSHEWQVRLTGFGTEMTLALHEGILSLKG